MLSPPLQVGISRGKTQVYENSYETEVEEDMKKTILVVLAVGLMASGLIGCFSLGETQTPQNSTVSQTQPQSQQKVETQSKKFGRLSLADREKLVIGADNRVTIESIEAVFQPQVIASIDEITEAKLSEPGRPYYFKLRVLYKGYDAEAKRARLQDLGKVAQSSLDNAIDAVFGVDSKVYSAPIIGGDTNVATLPSEANSIATFYLIATRITDEGNESGFWILFFHNIERPALDPSKFIVINGMHYITVEDAHAPTQQDVMMNFFMGGAAGKAASSNIFDPVVYPLADLMDARVAMDKKDYMNDYTFPAVRVKYVSEVIFKGQSNTTITVSTPDNVLTERMNFTGRASTVKTGEKIRVYYTIAKDPLEIWEAQAIERL
jgi:hypothetical protein